MKNQGREVEIISKIEALNEVERCENGIKKLNKGVKISGISFLLFVLTIMVLPINNNLGLGLWAASFVVLVGAVLFGGFEFVLKEWGWIFVAVASFIPFVLIGVAVGLFVMCVMVASFFGVPVLHFLATRAALKKRLKGAKAFVEFCSKEMEKEI